jgi:hypothetical protein
VSALGGSLTRVGPTWEKFRRNILEAGVVDIVEPVRAHSTEVAWDKPINLLFIDGLHDYAHVVADFDHFAGWVVPRGFVAFHDCADYFPGVKKFVNELIIQGEFGLSRQVRSLAVLEKV